MPATPPTQAGDPNAGASDQGAGFFLAERDRLRAKMRQDFPTIAAAVDACRARGCAVEVRYASEGPNERGRASAFSFGQAPDPYDVEIHRLFTQAQAAHARMMRGRRST